MRERTRMDEQEKTMKYLIRFHLRLRNDGSCRTTFLRISHEHGDLPEQGASTQFTNDVVLIIGFANCESCACFDAPKIVI